jgi:hypothetical protein
MEPNNQGKGVSMKTTKISEHAHLIEMPAELTDHDEKPYLNACPPPGPSSRGFIVIDFSKVQRINGLGISMLVKLSTLAGRRRQSCIAFGPSDHHRAVFDLTGLDHAMRVYRDQSEAMGVIGLPVPGGLTTAAPAAPGDVAGWAKPVVRLTVPPMPPRAINRNMAGRRVVGPVDGFGPLWQKTYRLPIAETGLSPEAVIQALKNNFPSFQPAYNRFYPTARGIAPGEVVAIDSSTPGGPVSTGVMVLYADDLSFTFITPQGHPESGWVTFSAFRRGGNLIAQIVGLARANDLVYEMAFRAIGSKMQIKIWTHVLESLARHLGVSPDVSVEAICVDPGVRWAQSGNVWYNAQIRTMLSAPVWWIGKKTSRRQQGKT